MLHACGEQGDDASAGGGSGTSASGHAGSAGKASPGGSGAASGATGGGTGGTGAGEAGAAPAGAGPGSSEGGASGSPAEPDDGGESGDHSAGAAPASGRGGGGVGGSGVGGSAQGGTGETGGNFGASGEAGSIGAGGGAGGSSGSSGAGGADSAAGEAGFGGADSAAGEAGLGGAGALAGSGGSAGDVATGGASGNSGSGGSAGDVATGGASGNAGSGGVAGSEGEPSGCGGEQATPGAEACNGEDDDCDGLVDEELGDFSCGVGACRTTVPACIAGAVSACVAAPPPAQGDSCNGVDDDCDGAIDEDCGECVHVSPTGNDAEAAADGVTPFASLQAAIDYASAESIGQVCVAAGATCGSTATYLGPASGDLTMRDGVSVLAGYRSSDWTRCSDSTTRIALVSSAGVLFPEDIARFTALDGFSLDRAAVPSTRGVSVDGARGVMLSNLKITGGPAATDSVGVMVANGGEATLFRSSVDGGNGQASSIGVVSRESSVSVLDNCPGTIDAQTGRCDTATSPSGGIRGRPSDGGGVSLGILLENAAGSLVERSFVSSRAGSDASNEFDAAAIRVVGDAEGLLIRANTVRSDAFADSWATGESARAIDLATCAGSAPWLVDNSRIEFVGNNVTSSTVRVSGDCHPVIDSNVEIVNDSANHGSPNVINCGGASTTSRCVIAGNRAIAGYGAVTLGSSAAAFYVTAVRCANQSCAKVSRNRIWGARGLSRTFAHISTNGGIVPTGLLVDGGNTLVSANVIDAGCSGGIATGANVVGPARLQNNQFRGTTSACSVFRSVRSYGLLARGDVDTHSNFVDGGELIGTRISGYSECRLWGAALGSGVTFRNNIVRTTSCGLTPNCETASESERRQLCSYAADLPYANGGSLVLENNSLAGGDALARNGTLTASELEDIAEVNGHPGSSENVAACGPFSVGPPFALGAGSTCIDAGTSEGAPALDHAGQFRDASPDIGPDEYIP